MKFNNKAPIDVSKEAQAEAIELLQLLHKRSVIDNRVKRILENAYGGK